MNNRPEIASPDDKARIEAIQSSLIDVLRHSNETDSIVMMNALIHLGINSAVVQGIPLETLLAVVTHHFTVSSEQWKASMT